MGGEWGKEEKEYKNNKDSDSEAKWLAPERSSGFISSFKESAKILSNDCFIKKTEAMLSLDQNSGFLLSSCGRFKPNSPLHQCPGGSSADESAGTMQLEGALLVGLAPEDSRLKRSPEVELGERPVRAWAADPDALSMAGRDQGHSCKASKPREAAPARPITEVSKEDPDTGYTSRRKPDALPRAKHPRKTEKAQLN